jgi:ATP-dependent DNA ligase
MQHTIEFGQIKNAGKANEISSEQNIQDIFDRKIKKKKDEGYTEDLKSLQIAINNPWTLPKQFAPAKPVAFIADVALQKLIDNGDCVVTHKRDGQRAFLFKFPNGSVKIMSRRMEDYTAHLSHLDNRDLVVNDLPNGTIIDMELVADEHTDNYNYVGSILRSKPNKAFSKQVKGGFLWGCVFDVLYWEGKDVTGISFADRQNLLVLRNRSSFLVPVERWVPQNIGTIKTKLKEYTGRGGEGFVIWDAASTTRIRYDGKPDRRGGAFKMKPVFEDDFYVRGFEYGKGKNAGLVGALFIFQRDENNNEIACGKVGSFAGSSKIRRELLDMDLESGELVVQVEFSKRNKDGLRFPVVQRVREDKRAHECIFSK